MYCDVISLIIDCIFLREIILKLYNYVYNLYCKFCYKNLGYFVLYLINCCDKIRSLMSSNKIRSFYLKFYWLNVRVYLND